MKLPESKFALAFLVKIPVSKLASPRYQSPTEERNRKRLAFLLFSASEKSDGPVA